MASVVLRSAGVAAGNALLPGIGGFIGGSLGRSFGGLIDGQLGLGASSQGPRLENLSVQDSRYGAGIPLVYGSARVAGNVIWSTDLIEAQHNSSYSGGKGGFGSGSSVNSTTYTYSVHCAVGIALGPVGGINTIWADSQVIYQNGVWAGGIIDSATIYTGTTTQNPDPFMESILGSGNVPAYRGLAYIVLENMQLANFGNRLPNLTFELVPVPDSSNPQWLGSVDAGIDQHSQIVQSGGMLPIILAGSDTEARSVLVGGYAVSGSTSVFEVAEYDVTDTVPVELARVSSASFAAASPFDSSWALAPDGRYVALYLQNSTVITHYLVIFDTETMQFGTVLPVNLAVGSSSTKQVAWIDAQHFVIDDISGTQRGLHIFARAGLGIVDLGFSNVWGSGTASSYKNFYYAQFTPFAGGLLNYVWDTTNPVALTLYVRPIAWQNNQLVVGSAYTLVSGLALGSGSGPHANLVSIGGGEWVLCYGNVMDYRLFFFFADFDIGDGDAQLADFYAKFRPGHNPISGFLRRPFGDRAARRLR